MPLDGVNFLVLNGNDEFDKYDFEQKIISLGGKIVQSPPETDSSGQFIAIAGKDCGIRVKNFRAMQRFDILDGQWILECEKKSSKIPFKTK